VLQTATAFISYAALHIRNNAVRRLDWMGLVWIRLDWNVLDWMEAGVAAASSASSSSLLSGTPPVKLS